MTEQTQQSQQGERASAGAVEADGSQRGAQSEPGGEQQLDAMLRGLEEQQAHGEGQANAASQSAAPAGDDQAAAGQPEGDQQFEDDLARQIQELLDEAQAEVHEATEQTAPDVEGSVAAATDAAAGQADRPPEREAGESAQTAQPAASTETASSTSETAQAPPSQSEAADASADEADPSLEQLDDILANEADDAVEGAFESPGEVLGEGSKAHQQAAASHASDPSAEPDQPGGVAEPVDSQQHSEPSNPGENQFASASEVTQDDSRPDGTAGAGDEASASADVQEADEDKEAPPPGAFASPDALLAEGEDPEPPSQATGFEAGADQVAAELDNQPEHAQPQPVSTEAAVDAANDAEASDWGRYLRRAIAASRTAAVQGYHLLRRIPMRRICATINAPAQRLSPQLRNTLGYVGLLTLFNAVVLMLAGLLFG